MTDTDDLVTCSWCQEDADEYELVGVLVTATSGPDGQPLYRCAACGPKTTRTPVISAELAEVIAFDMAAELLRASFYGRRRDDGR